MRPKTLGRVLAVLVVLVCAAGANEVMAQLGGSGGIQGSIADPGGAVSARGDGGCDQRGY